MHYSEGLFNSKEKGNNMENSSNNKISVLLVNIFYLSHPEAFLWHFVFRMALNMLLNMQNVPKLCRYM